MITHQTIGPICLLLFALTFISETKAEEKKEERVYNSPLSKIELNDGDCIVFLGDSITHQCLYTQYFENFIYTRFPNKRIKMHNAGVSGAQAWDALQRFDKDVAAYKPKYVTVLLGMNDGRYSAFSTENFSRYSKDMTTIIEKIEAIGAIPILMTPTMFDARARRMNPVRRTDEEFVSNYNSLLAFYGAWVREVAVKNGFGYVDMYGPLNQLTFEYRKRNPKFTMIADAIHPDRPGQVVMATSMVRDMGLPKALSSIRIQKDSKNELMAKTVGGKISDLKKTDSGIEFTWHADSLPWVLPEDANDGVRMTHLGHKFTREALEIHDIDSGYYEISIDDSVIGTFLSSNLGRHIELQANTKTPQYQQALKIAQLNIERNSKHIKNLRGQWSMFQGYTRRKLESSSDPKQQEIIQKRIANYEKRLEGMEKRVQQFEAAAKLIEDEIHKINKPIPRQYRLQKVAAPASKTKAKKAPRKKKVPAKQS